MKNASIVPLEPLPLERLRPVINEAYEDFEQQMRDGARRLEGRTVWNLNSSAEGGGVAALLASLLPYALDAGFRVRWAVVKGDQDFFRITKNVHNALHGVPPPDEFVWDRATNVYERALERSAVELLPLVEEGDVVLVHDPQVAALVRPLIDRGAAVAWQCHVGIDAANGWARRAWDFLRSFVEPAHRYVFTRRAHFWDGLDPAKLRIIPPSIDALSAKNAHLSPDEVRAILRASSVFEGADGPGAYRRSDGSDGSITRRVERVGSQIPLPEDARIVLEVSRWDRLKDPIGFLRMYADHLADRRDVHLVFAGPATVADDPEGAATCDACAEVWRSFDPSVQEHIHLLKLPMDDLDENAAIVNALQRRADVVVQKSIEEGFGLTVSEAMWKERPVVATRVGGIQDQIEHGVSGLLVNDPYDLAAFADAVRSVLDDDDCARRLGEEAQQRVREHFLGPRQLAQYADLLSELVQHTA